MIWIRCKKCGSAMTWDIKNKRLVCSVCQNTSYDKEPLARCPECKTRLKAGFGIISGECPKCHTPYVIGSDRLAEMISDIGRGESAGQNNAANKYSNITDGLKILPIRLTKEEAAKQIYKKELQYAYTRIKKISGKDLRLYHVPVKIFDNEKSCRVTAEGGENNSLLTRKDMTPESLLKESIPFDLRRLVGSYTVWQPEENEENNNAKAHCKTVFIPAYLYKTRKRFITINASTGMIDLDTKDEKQKEVRTFRLWNILFFLTMMGLWLLI